MSLSSQNALYADVPFCAFKNSKGKHCGYETDGNIDEKDGPPGEKIIIRPPSTGPAVSPAATTVPSIPNAFPLSEAGKVSTTSAGEQAISIAAAMPCKDRAAISHRALGAAPHNRDAIEKMKNPLQ